MYILPNKKHHPTSKQKHFEISNEALETLNASYGRRVTVVLITMEY